MSRVLITGVSSGIGQVLMDECLGAGHDVVGVVRRDEQCAELKKTRPGSLELRVCDLAHEGQVDELAGALAGADAIERFDYVVLNAGGADVGAFEALGRESIESILRTNLVANMHLVRALIPAALEHGTKFVFVSSICARLPGIQFASYAVSKAGLTQLYKSLAVEYPTIDWLCVELGGVETPFHAKAGYGVGRKRKSADDIGKRLYRAMLTKRGLCTLSFDWWITQRILMTFEGTVVGLLRWKERRRA